MIAWGDLTLEACLREDTLNFLKGSNFYAEEISAARGLSLGVCHRFILMNR